MRFALAVGLAAVGLLTHDEALAAATIAPPTAGDRSTTKGSVAGHVRAERDGAAIKEALLVLQCASLDRPLEGLTDEQGAFRFDDVPAGRCELEVLFKTASVTEVVTVTAGQTLRLNLRLPPPQHFSRRVAVSTTAVDPRAPRGASGAPNLPEGGTSRDFTAIVDLSPRGSAGTAVVFDGAPRRPEQSTRRTPTSTFSVDVDTGSFTNVRRRILDEHRLPHPSEVRIEEFVNYVPAESPVVTDGADVGIDVEVAPCPWSARKKIARVVVGARRISERRRPPLNLVFLVDVSGSMDGRDRLALIREVLPDFVDTLREDDRVSLVTYAGDSSVVLDGVSGDERDALHEAIAGLRAGGATHGSAGLESAYRIAQEHARRGSVSRVLLMTDGDFNVGVTSHGNLMRLIARHRDRGVFLNTLGFGMGNYRDRTMEQLADQGDGAYAYIDGPWEARRVLVTQALETLVPMAKDVKVQVEFNRELVAKYRLLGYENRALTRREFSDDRRDAGDMGAGQTVTALYELTPASRRSRRYRRRGRRWRQAHSELVRVDVRYKPNGATRSLKVSTSVRADEERERGSRAFHAALALAEYAMLLRGDAPRGAAVDHVLAAAAQAPRAVDGDDWQEFLGMVEHTRRLLGSDGGNRR